MTDLSACPHRRGVCVAQGAVEDRLVAPRRDRQAEPCVERGVDQCGVDPAAALGSRGRKRVADERVCGDRDEVVVVLELGVARFTFDRACAARSDASCLSSATSRSVGRLSRCSSLHRGTGCSACTFTGSASPIPFASIRFCVFTPIALVRRHKLGRCRHRRFPAGDQFDRTVPQGFRQDLRSDDVAQPSRNELEASRTGSYLLPPR